MEKASEFIIGVRLLLPGIIVATIFYLYSNAKFDQFFFIVFCVIFVGLTGVISQILWGIAKLAAGVFLRGWVWLKPMLEKLPAVGPSIARTGEGKPLAHLGPRRPKEATPLLVLAVELLVAVALGLLMVKVYENDFSFKIVNRIMSTEKLSAKDTLDYVSDHIAKKDWIRIDQRPSNKKLCKNGAVNCADDVYVRIRFKTESDIYEGAFTYYQSSGERLGMFLSPACVRRRLEPGKFEALQPVPGPGVYVNLTEIHSIEYWAIEDSDCFKLYYPPKAP